MKPKSNWYKSKRRTQLPADWPQRRQARLTHDNHQCQWIREDTGKPCHAPANEVDHKTDPHNHNMANLQSLCHYHHTKKTAKESGQARKTRNKKHNDPFTNHPTMRT